MAQALTSNKLYMESPSLIEEFSRSKANFTERGPLGHKQQHSGSTASNNSTLVDQHSGSRDSSNNSSSEQVAATDTQSAVSETSTQVSQRLSPSLHSSSSSFLIDDYVIIRTIGIGSLARVHLSKSKTDNKFYAIKALRKSHVVTFKQAGHVRDEVRVLRKLHHQFVLKCDAVAQDTDHLFLVLEFVEGGDLFTLIVQSLKNPTYKLSPEAAKFYASEVFLAVEYLHSQHVIHRDINPENIAIDAQGHIKLIDFGLAKDLVDNHHYTQTFCGKTDYMSPEVISGQPYGTSADWWAFGVVIFEMLFGRPPFQSASPNQVYQKIISLVYRVPEYAQDQEDLKSLFASLFTINPQPRQRAKQIKALLWFADVEWNKVNSKQVSPPFVPQIEPGTGNPKYFDKFPEDRDTHYGGYLGNGKYDNMFADLFAGF